jgi:hypothetical protein
MTPWYGTEPDCSKWVEIHEGEYVISPSCDRMFKGMGLIKSSTSYYDDAIKKLLNGPFVVSAMNAKIDAWSAQISDAVKLDKYGPGYATWTHAVQKLKSDLPLLRQQAEAELAEK